MSFKIGDPLTDYYEKGLVNLMITLQMIEEAMKRYIGWSYGIIEESLPEGIVFKHKKKDMDDWPYGKTLTAFKKLNGNTALHGKLRQHQTLRNQVAHNTFRMISSTDKLSNVDQHALVKEVTEHMKEVGETLTDLLGECKVQGEKYKDMISLI